MKFPYLNKLITYILIAIIFGPYIALQIFHPEWLVRFIAIATWGVYFTFSFLKEGLYKKNLMSAWHLKPPTNKTLLIEQICLSGLGLIIFIFFLPPIIKDAIILISQKENALIITQELVVQDAHIYIENVRFAKYPIIGRNEFYAPFFSPRHIMQGKTYEFVYLPNSHLILEAHPVNASGTRE